VTDVVITEFMDEAAVDRLREHHEVRYDPQLVDRPATLFPLLERARALIVRNRTRVDETLLAAAPQLRAVGRLGVGLDNIDLDACERRSIAVLPATGANAVSVAEYVVAALLVLRRGEVFRSNDRMLNGAWPRQDLVGREVAGMRLGLIGFGTIARMVADRARPLGMDIAAYDPYLAPDDAAWGQVRRAEDLPELLASCEAISVHVPATEATHHLLDAASLALLPSDGLVINTSRGGIVDEVALGEALRASRLGGAALDVFETEPLDAAAAERFHGVPNLVLTPHVAGVTLESNVAVSALVADRVRAVLDAMETDA
jgi:(S)-sulfolactate dehydrogenase